jgi:DNA modification methylase
VRTERIGDATLYLGDCRDVLPGLSGVDAVVTDPPYGIDYDYETYCDTPENLDTLINSVLIPASLIARRALIFCSHAMIWRYPPAVWVGCVSWNTTGSYGKLGVCQWTPFLFYGQDIAGFGSVNGSLKSDHIAISGGNGVGFRREEIIDHPCPKPVNMMARLVQRYTNAGEMVLDPFMGSGTTGVACARLGRSFIGIEIEPRYFDIACRRIEQAQRQRDLFVHAPVPVHPVETQIADLFAEAAS